MTRIDYSNVKYAQQGEAYTWPVSLAGVQPTDLITKVYLTLKKLLADADPGALQKLITTALVAGVGQITSTGASGKATGRFDFTGVQTAALSPQDYLFDVKAIAASGLPYYVDSGIFRVTQGVTTST